jgi:preprotein translocase subunit YajC
MIGGIGMFPLPAPVGTVVMIVLMIGIFYFILIRPQQKKMKKHQGMINNLSKGDQVVTEGGIYGSVVGLKENIVVLRIASVRDEDVKIEVSRARIAFLNKGGELIEGE